jgi:hypothetical protein
MLYSEYSDVAAYRLSLGEDTKAINQLVCFSVIVMCLSASQSIALWSCLGTEVF